MMSSEQVSHEGIIVSINGTELEIMIESKSACGGCAIKSACNMSESSNKKFMVGVSNPNEYAVGEKVTVVMNSSQGGKAAVYAYLVPSVILIAAILIFASIGVNEGLAAVFAIVLLVPYYLVLYINRNRLKDKFSFEIKHVN